MDPAIRLDDRVDTHQCLIELADSRLTDEQRSRLEDEAMREFLPIARRLAMRFTRPGAEFEDLTQVASLALLKAIRRFDPERGAFEKYAHATVSGELKRHLRDQCWAVRPPRRVQDLHSQIGMATETLAQSNGHSPDVAGLSQELGTPETEIREAVAARSCFRPASLDQPLDPSGYCLADTIEDGGHDFESVDDAMSLGQICEGLTDVERRMLWLRFVDGCSQREIAGELGMSQMMVSRRLSVIMSGLRSRFATPEVA